MSAYFITGTGTGIGKTFTTCALVHAARAAGRAVRAYKPVISGYSDAADSDTAQLIAAMGQGDVDRISPWRFVAPLSPDMAAVHEGRSITCAALVQWTQRAARDNVLVLIETVGGLMVPLNAQHTTRDWMAACDLPLVMVTGSYLGALSHTLTTLESARAVGLRVAALIVNESAGSTVDLEDTRVSIANHARDIPLILAQPLVSSPAQATVTQALLEQLL